MKAIAIDSFGDVSKLRLEEFPVPQPSAGEVLIKIEYSGVNPVDWKIREGAIQNLMPHDFPIILGWEAAGTVAALGEGVTTFKEGDEVFAYCRKPTVQMGTYAEYITFEEKHVAPKPKNLTFAQAAGIPLCALTAWQALFDDAKLTRDETVLIHAGAGGVGSMAIQFAKHAGAKVITTASEKNHGYVKKLGADMAIDYTKDDFVRKVKEIAPEGVDVVFDCAGYDTLERSFEVVKKGGRLISIVSKPDPAKAAEKNLRSGFTFVRPEGAQLREIARLLESGKVQPPVVEEFALTDAAKAQEQSKSGHTVGKLVLKI